MPASFTNVLTSSFRFSLCRPDTMTIARSTGNAEKATRGLLNSSDATRYMMTPDSNSTSCRFSDAMEGTDDLRALLIAIANVPSQIESHKRAMSIFRNGCNVPAQTLYIY